MKQKNKKQLEFYLLHSNAWLFCFPVCFNSRWFSLPPLCFLLICYPLRAKKNGPNEITLQVLSVHNGYNRNVNISYVLWEWEQQIWVNESRWWWWSSYCQKCVRFHLPAFTPSPTSCTGPIKCPTLQEYMFFGRAFNC